MAWRSGGDSDDDARQYEDPEARRRAVPKLQLQGLSDPERSPRPTDAIPLLEADGCLHLERSRLEEAWKSLVSFKHSAHAAGRADRACRYLVMVLPWLTTVSLVLKILLSHLPDRSRLFPAAVARSMPQWLLGWLLSDLNLNIAMVIPPILVGLVLAWASRSLPQHRQAHLMSAANMIRTEIYCYRAGAGRYARRLGERSAAAGRPGPSPRTPSSTPITQRLHSPSPRMPPPPPARLHSPSPRALRLAAVEPAQWRCPDGSRDQKLSEFDRRMGCIHDELASSSIDDSQLRDPPKDAMQAERRSLVGARDSDTFVTHDAKRDGLSDNARGEAAKGAVDDGVSRLSTGEYVSFRARPAAAALSRLSQDHARAISRLETARYVAAMLCLVSVTFQMYMVTPLVAISIALPTSLLDHHQLDIRLQSVRSAHRRLQDMLLWWEGLGGAELKSQHVLDYVVDVTELALQADDLGMSKVFTRFPMAYSESTLSECGGSISVSSI